MSRVGNEWAKPRGLLKLLALELRLTILFAVQLNRDADGREPSLGQLRDSGSIEQDADRVILLHRRDDDVEGRYPGSFGHRREESAQLDRKGRTPLRRPACSFLYRARTCVSFLKEDTLDNLEPEGSR